MEEAPEVLVRELVGEELNDLGLRVLCGEAKLDENRITNPRVQKPGLAFAGYYAYIKPGRVQIIGESETEYMRTVAPDRRADEHHLTGREVLDSFLKSRGFLRR